MLSPSPACLAPVETVGPTHYKKPKQKYLRATKKGKSSLQVAGLLLIKRRADIHAGHSAHSHVQDPHLFLNIRLVDLSQRRKTGLAPVGTAGREITWSIY